MITEGRGSDYCHHIQLPCMHNALQCASRFECQTHLLNTNPAHPPLSDPSPHLQVLSLHPQKTVFLLRPIQPLNPFRFIADSSTDERYTTSRDGMNLLFVTNVTVADSGKYYCCLPSNCSSTIDDRRCQTLTVSVKGKLNFLFPTKIGLPNRAKMYWLPNIRNVTLLRLKCMASPC